MASLMNIMQSLRLPVIASPMFIVSSKEMVLEQCKAGVIGSFPALNARGECEFEAWLEFLTRELDKYNQDNPDQPAAPFAVNQIVFRSNKRLHQDMALCVKYKVPIVITSLGAVPEINDAAHSYGGVVLHDVINMKFARKAIEKGADGLIAVANGAGGHTGQLNPLAFIQEIRQWFDGPLALSGCIATGGSILAARAMGADFAYMGSTFIATKEANAAHAYKEMVVGSYAKDIVYSNYFTGVHGNYLKQSIVQAGLDPDNLPQGNLDSLNEIGDTGDAKKVWKDIWGCGQGIGVVDEVQTVADKIAQLEREYLAAKQRIV